MNNQWPAWVRMGVGAMSLVILLVVLYLASDAARDQFLANDQARYGVEEVWLVDTGTGDSETVDVTPAFMYTGARGVAESRKHGECLFGQETSCMPNGYYLEVMEEARYPRARFADTEMLVLRIPPDDAGAILVNGAQWVSMSFDEFAKKHEECWANVRANGTYTGGDYTSGAEYVECGGYWFNPTLEGDKIVSLKYRYLP